MDKKGQIYVISALILSVIIYGLSGQFNRIETEPQTDFSEISDNYATESSRVVNYALYSAKDIRQTLTLFTKDFLEYARSKEPNIGLVYVYGDDQRTLIENYLKTEDTILVETADEIKPMWSHSTETPTEMVVNIGGNIFRSTVPTEISDFGDRYGSMRLKPTEAMRLDISGVFYDMNLLEENPEFKVIIKNKKKELVELTCYDSNGKRSCE